MESKSWFLLAADLLLMVHFLLVVFVVSGLVLILLGRFFRWEWVRGAWFRVLHLLAIGIVVVQSWLGVTCPLTSWEMALRERAGDVVYPGSFIAYWLDKILYYQAPEWVFTLCYTIFGLSVVVCWFWVKPRHFKG